METRGGCFVQEIQRYNTISCRFSTPSITGQLLNMFVLPCASIPARSETQVMRRISHPTELTSIQQGGNTPIRLLQTTRFNLRQPFPTFQDPLPVWCSEGSRTSKETFLVYSIRTANKAESSQQALPKHEKRKPCERLFSDIMFLIRTTDIIGFIIFKLKVTMPLYCRNCNTLS